MKHISWLLIGLSIWSCTYDEGPFLGPGQDPNNQAAASFANDIQPIFNRYCTNCHSERHSKLKLVPDLAYNQLTTDGAQAPYVDLNSAGNSLLLNYLKGIPTIMPPSGPIPDFEILTITRWIENGANND